MLSNLNTIPADFTQETSLNGKYIKGIPTAVTDPDVNTGNANHTHASDGDHGHAATVPSHSHTGVSGSFGQSSVNTGGDIVTPFNHTHNTTTSALTPAEASNDGDHTHDALSNDIEHRTITFYKKTATILNMSRKSLPRKMTFFYSKSGVLPTGLVENLLYDAKHFKGDPTPGTDAGSNLHQHDNEIHNHPTDISDHEHTISFGATGSSSPVGSAGPIGKAPGGHTHGPGTAATINKSSTPITSGNDSGHNHDDLNHEPSFKELRLMEVNVLQMGQVGVPKNCLFLWLDLLSLITAGWQVSDGTNDTLDMLDVYPKGKNTTPGGVGGNDTHTHSSESTPHAHTGADVGHSHDTTGNSDLVTQALRMLNAGGLDSPGDHGHTPGSVTAQAAQTITITSSASNHDHGAISNDPDSKTVAFIERVIAA